MPSKKKDFKKASKKKIDKELTIDKIVGDGKITLKQKRFLKYYLQDPSNGAEAARKAGYSEKYAKEAAYHLTHKSTLLPYLQAAAKTGEFEIALSVEDVISKIEGIAETNIFDFIDIVNGRAILIKNLRDIPYEYGQLIRTIKETANGLEISFYDKTKALEMLLKAKGSDQPAGSSFELAYKL